MPYRAEGWQHYQAALQPALAILKRSIKDVAFIGSVLPTQIDLKSPRADI
jgi:hypothetical protein